MRSPIKGESVAHLSDADSTLYIDFLDFRALIRDQEVEGSNPFAPTTFTLVFIGLLIMPLLPPKFVAQITILEA
jgi:hypothetical protein